MQLTALNFRDLLAVAGGRSTPSSNFLPQEDDYDTFPQDIWW